MHLAALVAVSISGFSLEIKDGTYGWVPIQPSQPKQAIFRTGFDFTVFFSGILQFQLVQSLTRRWTYSKVAQASLKL